MDAMDTQPAGTNLTGLRDHNTALVMGLLRAATDGGSRVELAAATGLTPQAISKIVARLLADGVVEETGRATSTGGKPRTLLRLRPDAAYVVGLAVDRDESTIVLGDLAGAVSHHVTHPVGLASAQPDRVIESLAAQVRAAIDTAPREARVLGVGVGCRGPLDYASGILHRPAGLAEWDRYPFRDALTAQLDGLPVLLDKDTNAAALALQGPGGAAYLHVSDGVGAGLLLGGAIYRGARTNAGEFGHQVLRLDGPECTCGQRGCIEALCLAALADGDHREVARLLGVGAANLVRLLDIDRIALGGRVVFAEPETYLSEVTAQLTARLPEPDWQRVTVELSPSGASAIAAGALELALGPLFGTRS
jgi:predicted NBD/HSP70 family sugar kinase